MVDTYFRETLPNREPPGMFLLTRRAFGPNGISPGEKLIFSYKGECVYRALAATERMENGGDDVDRYPYYFRVDVPSIKPAKGTLKEIQDELGENDLEQQGLPIPNLVKSQSWPRFTEGELIARMIDAIVFGFDDTPLATDIADVPADRVKTTIYRILRDTEKARRVKILHEHRCQICGHAIELSDGRRYAEAHHIQPLGDPHKGPDVIGNILCVCPNHHAELDYRTSELTLAALKVAHGHFVEQKYVDYHNGLFQARRQ
jgi:hypothetical protein